MSICATHHVIRSLKNIDESLASMMWLNTPSLVAIAVKSNHIITVLFEEKKSQLNVFFILLLLMYWCGA